MTRSAMIRPPVASRFARIRSGCTSSPSSTSRIAAAAPPVRARASESGCHSACQPPAARSCSCARPPVSRPACACTRRAQAIARIEPVGLRLCGMRRGAAAPDSATSPTSVCDSSTTSSAIFESAPAARSSAAASSATRTRVACHGSAGSARPSSSREAREHGGALLPERGERARAAAELDGEPLARTAREPAPRLEHADQPARRLEPEGRRQRLLHAASARPSASSGASRRARRRPRRPRRARRGSSSSASRATSIAAVSSDVLARRAPVDVPARVAGGLGERAHERLDRAADPARTLRERRDRRSGPRRSTRRSPLPPRPGSLPPAASARASAASASSIAWSQARSETASRSGAGTKIGVEEPVRHGIGSPT